MMINKDECFYLGKISKKTGFRGCLSIKLKSNNPSFYLKKKYFFVEINNKLTPFHIESISYSNNNFFKTKFLEINNEESANLLIGSLIYLPLEERLKTKNNDTSNLNKLIGYTLKDRKKSIGKIVNIISQTIQPLLEVEYKHKKVLIPYDKEMIKKTDQKARNIVLDLPEGLLEI